MALEVIMPVITVSGEEAVVTAWFVDEGATCSEGQMIAEVQAEKISAEVEAPGTGVVVDRVGVNVAVPQGEPICRIVDSTTDTAAPSETQTATVEESESPRGAASPAARRLARELGVDLVTVTGTGPGGRITEADVRLAGGPEPAAATESLRTVIARNMLRASNETAAVTLHSTVDLGRDAPTSITANVVKVVAEVLADHPRLNGRREDGRFTPVATAQIAVAVQTDEGLVAPVVKNASDRTIEEISSLIRDLAERAGTRTLTAEDFEGGTFTVTNLGAYGIDGFTPIINLPQVAILGVGAVRRVATVENDGSVTAHHQMVLSLTFDHAFVDGAPAAAFLREVGAALAK